MTKLGFQLYSARNFTPLSNTLQALAKAGYAEVEGYGALYSELDAHALKTMKDELDDNGLSMSTGHFGLDLLENEPARAMLIARTLGIEAIYCPYLMPDQRPTDGAGWFAFGKRLSEAGRRFRDAGYAFGWHNHDFEFKPLADGSIPLDHILAGGPDLDWEADIAWIIRGGDDPFTWIERYGERIGAVHVKDIAAAGKNADEDGWADVGHGTVDWKRLMAALRNTRAKYFIIEHDNPSDVGRLIRRSIAAFNTY